MEIVVPDSVIENDRYLRPEDLAEGKAAFHTADSWALRLKSKHQGGRPISFSLYFRNAAIGTRKVYQGPVEHEDYAYMVAHPTVIALYPGPRPVVVEANVGDTIVFANHTWLIVEDRALHDPYLVMVS